MNWREGGVFDYTWLVLVCIYTLGVARALLPALYHNNAGGIPRWVRRELAFPFEFLPAEICDRLVIFIYYAIGRGAVCLFVCNYHPLLFLVVFFYEVVRGARAFFVGAFAYVSRRRKLDVAEDSEEEQYDEDDE